MGEYGMIAPLSHFEGLNRLLEQLELQGDETRVLDPYREVFAARKNGFADFLFARMERIPEARIILHRGTGHNGLKALWAQWFETFWDSRVDQRFFFRAWRSGQRHVEIRVDQRHVNLGYILARQFCHRMICEEIPAARQFELAAVVDKLLDLCLLVETEAYLSNASQCDQEVIRGVAHQVRNPITIIGGNIKRLQKTVPQESPMHSVYDAIMAESRRLERMVRDVGAYAEISQRAPHFEVVPIRPAVDETVAEFAPRYGHVGLEVGFDGSAPDVQADPADLRAVLHYVLENSFEAMDAARPWVRIQTHSLRPKVECLRICVTNSGSLPAGEDPGRLFVPFYSTKPEGTGFGLAIARAALLKNYGEIALAPSPGEGTVCVMTLPLPQPGITR